jgi:hypothetical protein
MIVPLVAQQIGLLSDMSRSRFFAPGFVALVAPYFVAVDIVQPVAVVVSQHGELVSIESWAHHVAAPSESSWPNRRFGIASDRLLVQDLPVGEVVSLAVESDATMTTRVVPASSFSRPGVSVKHPRMLSAPRGNRAESGEGWHFSSRVHRYRWSAEVAFRRGGAATSWPVENGSIVARAWRDLNAAVCVRRGPSRPWEFDPAYELFVLRAGRSGGVESIQVPPIDVTERCWNRKVDPLELVRMVREYMDFALGGCRAAIKHGARDVRLELRQIESDPVIELSFELTSMPDVRVVRIDKPVNELGHLAGLRFLNITLEEDLGGSSLIEVLREDVGAVDGRLYI